jgi:hypothetical protein
LVRLFCFVDMKLGRSIKEHRSHKKTKNDTGREFSVQHFVTERRTVDNWIDTHE